VISPEGLCGNGNAIVWRQRRSATALQEGRRASTRADQRPARSADCRAGSRGPRRRAASRPWNRVRTFR